jgi:hypothetical protein
MPMLAGISVSADVGTLAELLRGADFTVTADKLERALMLETKVLALTITDRESILRALDEPPSDGLAELRGLLLREHEWRVDEGLVSSPDELVQKRRTT